MNPNTLLLSVAKCLPEVFKIQNGVWQQFPVWLDTLQPVTPREWLEVAHCAENTLDDTDDESGYCERDRYALALLELVGYHKAKTFGDTCEADYFQAANAPAEARFRAFLKVKGVEVV